MTITEIQEELDRMAAWLKDESGYTEVSPELSLTGGKEIRFYLCVKDDFSKTPGGYLVNNYLGGIKDVPIEDFDCRAVLDEGWTTIQSGPSRAEREVSILARKMCEQIEGLDAFESEAAMVFLERVRAAREEVLDRFLTDERT